MKLTVQDMNAMVKYMGENEVSNVELVASSISWGTPSDVMAITESGGKYEMVKRPLNPPATELSVIELVGAVDVENGLESLYSENSPYDVIPLNGKAVKKEYGDTILRRVKEGIYDLMDDAELTISSVHVLPNL